MDFKHIARRHLRLPDVVQHFHAAIGPNHKVAAGRACAAACIARFTALRTPKQNPDPLAISMSMASRPFERGQIVRSIM